jgi:hypothetical protein
MNDQEGYVDVTPDWRGINIRNSRLNGKHRPKFVYLHTWLDSVGEMLVMHLLSGKVPFTVHVPMHFRGPVRVLPPKLPRKPVDVQLARRSCQWNGTAPTDALNEKQSVIMAREPDFSFGSIRLYSRPFGVKACPEDFVFEGILYGYVSRMAAGYMLVQAGLPRVKSRRAKDAFWTGYLITPAANGSDDLGQSLPKYKQGPTWVRIKRSSEPEPRQIRPPRRQKHERMDERVLAQLAPRVLPGKKVRVEPDFVLGGYEYELVKSNGEKVRFHCIEVKGNRRPPDTDPQMRAYRLLEMVRGIKTLVLTLPEIEEYVSLGNFPITRVR